ncbi:MAG: tRNA epoxyqueuosine(34) reductase QueG [Pseudomonadota bacterium]
MPPIESPSRKPSATVKLQTRIADRGEGLGFETVRFVALEDESTDAAFAAAKTQLRNWLADGRHGEMTWMADTFERRTHPKSLWPDAQSAIVVGHNYGPDYDPLARIQQSQRGAISAYAKRRDYHDVLKGRLKVLAGEIAAWTGKPVKVFVDTAPLMEKVLASVAGLGWQGKHTNLVSRDFGSWLFLGTILSAADSFATSPAVDDACGHCRRCLDVCPTDAFPAPYQLDARRCIAYLTIEHKGHIPHQFREAIGNRVFGCDDCLAVCPWNKFAVRSQEAKYAISEACDDPPLQDLLALDDAAFRKRFAGTPIKRTGRDRFVRNVAIAAGNSQDASLIPMLEALATDMPPLVRVAAVWALSRFVTNGLLDPGHFTAMRDRQSATETDATVRAEWTTGLSPATEPGTSP